MKHSERGCERSVRRVRVGHVIRWCDRDCRVLAIAWPPPRTSRQRRRFVYFTVAVPDLGEHTLGYESTERVIVVDYDDPRLAETRHGPCRTEAQQGPPQALSLSSTPDSTRSAGG